MVLLTSVPGVWAKMSWPPCMQSVVINDKTELDSDHALSLCRHKPNNSAHPLRVSYLYNKFGAVVCTRYKM